MDSEEEPAPVETGSMKYTGGRGPTYIVHSQTNFTDHNGDPVSAHWHRATYQCDEECPTFSFQVYLSPGCGVGDIERLVIDLYEAADDEARQKFHFQVYHTPRSDVFDCMQHYRGEKARTDRRQPMVRDHAPYEGGDKWHSGLFFVDRPREEMGTVHLGLFDPRAYDEVESDSCLGYEAAFEQGFNQMVARRMVKTNSVDLTLDFLEYYNSAGAAEWESIVPEPDVALPQLPILLDDEGDASNVKVEAHEDGTGRQWIAAWSVCHSQRPPAFAYCAFLVGRARSNIDGVSTARKLFLCLNLGRLRAARWRLELTTGVANVQESIAILRLVQEAFAETSSPFPIPQSYEGLPHQPFSSIFLQVDLAFGLEDGVSVIQSNSIPIPLNLSRADGSQAPRPSPSSVSIASAWSREESGRIASPGY